MNFICYAGSFLFASLALAGVVHAQTPGCIPISGIPVVITAPGTYCVMGLLTTSQTTGAAIEIQSNDVVLDFTSGGIDGLAGGTDTAAVGVYSLDHSNITITNGLIRGFGYGIALENSAPDFASTTGIIVSQMDLVLNRGVGIEVRGTNAMLTGNLLESTGTDGPGGAVAISIFGPGAYLYQNSAVTTETQTGSTQAIGIRIIGGPGCDVEQNRLVNTVSGQNASYGIQVWSSSDCMVRNNDIDNRTAAKPLDIGVYIIDSKHVQTISNTMTNVARNTVR